MSKDRKINLHIFDCIGIPPGYALYHIEKKGTQHAIPTQKTFKPNQPKFSKTGTRTFKQYTLIFYRIIFDSDKEF